MVTITQELQQEQKNTLEQLQTLKQSKEYMSRALLDQLTTAREQLQQEAQRRAELERLM